LYFDAEEGTFVNEDGEEITVDVEDEDEEELEEEEEEEEEGEGGETPAAIGAAAGARTIMGGYTLLVEFEGMQC
jgi:hypothetical protein